MQALATLVKVFGLLIVAVLAQKDTGEADTDAPWFPYFDPDDSEWPIVQGMRITNESLSAHHTDHFEMEMGFAVRRGQDFDLLVKCNTEIDLESDEILMGVDLDENETAPHFRTQVVSNEGSVYRVRVSTDVDSPVGKYESVVLFVATKGQGPDGENLLYRYPFPVYVLFNPWLPEDHVVYLPTEELRQEHILNDYGLVFDGSLHSYRSIQWFYGPSKQVALDAVFHVLSNMNRSDAGNALDVIFHISRNEGFHKMVPGHPVGNLNGLLEGKWSGNFSDGTNPDLWTSTIDILNIWKETGQATKYGQCWIFAALQTTLMRAIGVGARQLSAFGAMVDASPKLDHKVHHVVDSYFDKDGSVVDRLGMVWNYHSWNSVWINREDNATLSGWHSLDGTPPGMGPASDIAVKEQREDVLFNTSSIISYVKSTVRDFLVDCKPEHKKMDGCKILKLLSYDPHGVKLILSSKTSSDGKLEPNDITANLVDPTKDAYIPFDKEVNGNKPAPHSSASAGQDQHKNVDRHAAALKVKVTPGAHRVLAGQFANYTVTLTRSKSVKSKPVSFNLGIKASLVDRQGKLIKDVYSSSESIETEYPWTKLPIQVHISPDMYIHQDLSEAYLRVTAVVQDNNGDDHAMSSALVVLDAPQIHTSLEHNPTEGNVVLRATAKNPHRFPLTNVCMTLHTHDSELVHEESGSHVYTRCVDLQPNETITLRSTVSNPKQKPLRPMAALSGPFMPTSFQHLQ